MLKHYFMYRLCLCKNLGVYIKKNQENVLNWSLTLRGSFFL